MHSIEFFEQQFQQQVAKGEFALNPFEGLHVLTEVTAFIGALEPGHHYLFGKHELDEAFKGWEILLSRHDELPAPDNTAKQFHTVVARRPG